MKLTRTDFPGGSIYRIEPPIGITRMVITSAKEPAKDIARKIRAVREVLRRK